MAIGRPAAAKTFSRGGRRPKRARLAALADRALSSQQRELLRDCAVPRVENPYNIYRTLVRHPVLFRSFMPFSRHTKDDSTLRARERELVILRVGWLCGAAYESAHHSRIASAISLTTSEID